MFRLKMKNEIFFWQFCFLFLFIYLASGFSGDQTAAIQHHKTASSSGGSSVHSPIPSSSSSSSSSSSASAATVSPTRTMVVISSPRSLSNWGLFQGPSHIFVPLCVPFLIMPYALAKVSLAFTHLFSTVWFTPATPTLLH